MSAAILVPCFLEEAHAVAFVQKCTTERLKELRGSYCDEWCQKDERFLLINAIHLEMNLRGEGRYVAV